MSSYDNVSSIAIIGCGEMGSALLLAIYINKLETPPLRIILTTKSTKSAEKLRHKFSELPNINNISLDISNDNRKLVEVADLVILAVEPFLAIHVLEEIKDSLNNKLLISIIAGFSIDKLSKYSSQAAILMTSTLINFTKVPIALTLNESSGHYKSYITQLFAPVGDMIEIKSKDLNVTGSVLGCSTLFTLIFVDAVIKGGVSRGLTVEQSKQMIVGVLKGTAVMLEKSGKSPDEIINSLCTPGGTTIDGILSLEESNFRYLVSKLVQISSDKAAVFNK